MLWIVEKVLSYGAKGPITIVSARLLILQNITFVMNIRISIEPLSEIRPKKQIFTIVESLNDDNFFTLFSCLAASVSMLHDLYLNLDGKHVRHTVVEVIHLAVKEIDLPIFQLDFCIGGGHQS